MDLNNTGIVRCSLYQSNSSSCQLYTDNTQSKILAVLEETYETERRGTFQAQVSSTEIDMDKLQC